MKYSITTVENVDTGEFFFSTEHSDQGLGEPWVPVTYYLPRYVTPRSGFERCVIKNKEDLKTFKEVCGHEEISNPNPVNVF